MNIPFSTGQDYKEFLEDKKKEKECKKYLGYCYKEGCIDESEAKEIIKNRDWDAVYEMMSKAEAYADVERDEYES